MPIRSAAARTVNSAICRPPFLTTSTSQNRPLHHGGHRGRGGFLEFSSVSSVSSVVASLISQRAPNRLESYCGYETARVGLDHEPDRGAVAQTERLRRRWR